MVRFKGPRGVLLLALLGHGVSQGGASSLLTERCSSLCSRPPIIDSFRALCEQICNSLEPYSREPCFQALANSSDQHLTLLSYSSGHILETIAILTGAAMEENTELYEYIAGLHVQDRGSPESCRDIHDAHYCVAQGSPSLPVGPILGLCVPRSCDSATLTNLLVNITMSEDDNFQDNDAARLLGSPAVICGDESRLSADAGTTCTLIAVGCLVALVVVGTRLDYEHHLRRDKLAKAPVNDGDRDTTRTGDRDPQELLHSGGSSTASNLDSNGPTREACENEQGVVGNESQTTTVESNALTEDQVEDGEHGEDAHLTASTEAIEGSNGRELVESNEASIREPLLNKRLDNAVGHEGDESRLVTCLKCFSLRTNLIKLFSPARPSNEFGALDGVRTLSIIWVIFSHSILFWGSSRGFTNSIDFLPVDGHGVLARWTSQPILAGSYAVDSFFLMSGFLVSSILLPKLESGSVGKGPWMLKVYLHRYLRLTPTVAFITLVRWQLFPLVSDSPGWWSFATTVRDNCRKQWWGEITYVTNLVPWPPMANRCNIITYYLADDVQFFLASVPLVTLYHHHPRTAIATLVSVMVASWSYKLWFTFDNDIPSSFIASRPLARETSKVYATPWCRNSAYIIGLLCGIMWHVWLRDRVGLAARQRQGDATTSNRDTRIRQAISVTVITMSALLLALPVYGAYWGNQDSQEVDVPDWLDHMHYVFGRSSWVLGLALMCGLCFCGYGGFINTFLTLPPWTVLSRLTFCIYLTHTFLVEWLCESRDLALRFTFFELTIMFLGTTLGAIALAGAVHLLVEAPFRNLESLSRRRGRHKTTSR